MGIQVLSLELEDCTVGDNFQNETECYFNLNPLEIIIIILLALNMF